MRAMIIKEFRELRRDRRTMAMLIALPIILLIIFGYAANFNVSTLETAVVGPNAQAVADRLPELFEVTDIDPSGTADTAQTLLQDAEDVVAIDTGSAPPTAYVDGSSLFAAQTAVAAFNQLGDAVTVDILYNPDLTTAWVLVPPLTGLILMFIGTVVTAIGLVRERENGTIEQLAVMPIRPSTVIVGKIAPYFVIAAVDMAVVTILGILLFGVPFNGSIALFIVGAGSFLFVVLGIGVLISTASQNAGQAIQMAIFFLLPQVLLSGMIFPLDAMPWGVRWISYVLPLTYYTKISIGIMLRSAGFMALWMPFAILAVMAVVAFLGSILRFRRELAPGGRRHTEIEERA
jgi:ABC-type multidrug transport system permease subunit